MSPTYAPILTPEDAKAFIQAVNDLHDGEITAIDYRFTGITKLPEGGHMYAPDMTELHITVLVTSIWDSVGELVFEALDDWQLKGKQSEIYGVMMDVGGQGSVIWTTAHSTDMKYIQESNYVISRHMKWRFIEDNRPDEYK
jgi:hypothetical protein